MLTTDCIIASILPSTLCDWSIMKSILSTAPAPVISLMIRKSSNGSIEPTIRSSSAYLRLLKWKPPSSPSSISRATICSMFVPIGWWPVSTSTCACGPSRRHASAAVPQSGVAEAIAFFAGPRTGKSTGNVVNVDGGVAAAYPR